LMNVSRMKSCSVPQIGDKWEWKQFNKIGPKPKAGAAAASSTANSASQPPKTRRPTVAERTLQAAQAALAAQTAQTAQAAQAAEAAQDARIAAAVDAAADSIIGSLTALTEARQQRTP
jgi:hypothetical protein